MKAVMITDDRKAEVCEVPNPILGRDEVLLKVDTSMLCTWDQRVFLRKMPFPLPFLGGHEFSGSIVEIGADVNPELFPIGAKAAGNMLYPCRSCENCRSGEKRLCEHMEFHQQGLAEYIAVRQDHVFVADREVSFEDLAFTEPLGCVVQAFEKFNLNFGETMVILGGGIMGQMAIKLAKNRGARVILSDPIEARRIDALKNGADVVLDPTAGDPVEAVKKLTKGGAQIAFNTVAIPVAITQGLGMLGMGGTFLMFGKVFPNEPVPVDINLIHDRDLRLVGTMSAMDHAYQRAIKLICGKQVCPTEMNLLSEVYKKEDCMKAFDRAMSSDTYRVAFKF